MGLRALAVVEVGLVACTPFGGTESAPAAADAAPVDASNDASGPVRDAALDGGDYCAGSFLCDEFERTAVDQGEIPWLVKVLDGGTLGIVDQPGRGRGLVVEVLPADSEAQVSVSSSLPSTGRVAITASLTYEVLRNETTGAGYTDLLIVSRVDTGYADLVIGSDAKLHLTTGCAAAAPCTGYGPLLPQAAGSGLHELVYTARFTGDDAAGVSYALDQDPPIDRAVALPALPAGSKLFVQLGADRNQGQGGALEVRYERVSIRADKL